jgi:hypothetical protein
MTDGPDRRRPRAHNRCGAHPNTCPSCNGDLAPSAISSCVSGAGRRCNEAKARADAAVATGAWPPLRAPSVRPIINKEVSR